MRTVDRVCLKIRNAEFGEGAEVDLVVVNMRFSTWLSTALRVSEIDLETAEAADGWITLAGIKVLASEVRQFQIYYIQAAANDLAEGNDRARCLKANDMRLWAPSLFPQLDYDELRLKDIVTHEGKRRILGQCTNAEWTQWEEINVANDRSQDKGRRKRKTAERSRQALWRKHPECKTTDDLMRKVHGWRPKPV
jgi:hypothetical protein